MSASSNGPNGAAATANSVRVEIFDQHYNLRGSDSDYVHVLAEYVDTKMRAVAEQTATIDSMRLAVLAALNIADEYHILKRKYDSIASDLSRRTSMLEGALEEVLEEPRRAG
ncbi:MAG: cell division protein ZapA [Terriglobales bacterium]